MHALLLSLLMSGVAPIEWVAPPECPQAEAVAQDVDRLVRREPGPSAVTASAAVRTTPWDGYALTLRIERPDARERYALDGPDCVALAGAAALLIATAIDADASPSPAVAQSPGRQSARPFAGERAGEGSPPARRDSMPRRASTAAPRAQVSLGGGYFVGAGRESPVSHGPSLGVAVLRRRLRLEAHARYAIPVSYQPEPARTVVATAMLGSLAGCGRLYAGPIEFPGCLVAEAGQFTARGRGWEQNRTVRRLSVGLGVSLGLRARLGARVALAADAQTLVAVASPQLNVDGNPVWRASPVGARLALGVEVRLGRLTR